MRDTLIRDYYVEIESEEDGVEVKAFYCPKLNNGKRMENKLRFALVRSIM